MAVLDEPSSLARVLARDVRPAIDLVDGLRDCGVDRDVTVPQICVVGDQSSGKSSVLDAICGVPLPRGAGLTTRCAVELHLSDGRHVLRDPDMTPQSPMQDVPDATDRRSQWRASIATSLNPTPVPVRSLEALGSAIAELTAQLTDDRRSSGFSKERLIIHMVAPDLPNLTLIDLPGIIRTKTFNMPFIDANNTAMAEVRDLIQSYMRQERTIILVVVPCTQDVATIEGLEWASRFDPSGERTIGVLTKPDLIDPAQAACSRICHVAKQKPARSF
jgi:interferon-induced GTP-binding protein Mx